MSSNHVRIVIPVNVPDDDVIRTACDCVWRAGSGLEAATTIAQQNGHVIAADVGRDYIQVAILVHVTYGVRVWRATNSKGRPGGRREVASAIA
jgi:hypothetical protein